MSRSWNSFLLIAILAAPALHGQVQANDSTTLWVNAGPLRLKAGVFQSRILTPHPTLVIVLHGDAPFSKPSYQDRFAQMIAAKNSDVIAAAILRPGYTDGAGHTSDGVRGETTGANYNVTSVSAIEAAIVTLKRRFQPNRIVLVGHSGGAAIAADILARHPTLASGALLVSCPCDVTRWRAHMLAVTGYEGFKGTIETLSPIELVRSLSPTAKIVMMVGDTDNVAPPRLDSLYVAAAAKAGATVTLIGVAGRGHEILLEPEVVSAVGELLKSEK